MALAAGGSALIERERELAVFNAALGAAEAGTGRAVIVEGEPGIGKTRLLSELSAEAAARGALVLSGRATDLERDYPFGVIRTLLRPVVVDRPPRERARLLRGTPAPIRALLGIDLDATAPLEHSPALLDGLFRVVEGLSAEDVVVACIDDVQWADANSLRALAYFANRAHDLRLVLAVARRAGEPATEAGVLPAIAAVPDAARIVPRPLSVDGAARLAAARSTAPLSAADAAALHAVTRGNPLLVSHVAESVRRAGAGALISPSALTATAVSGIVLERLTEASPEAQAVARAVAVLGDGSPAAYVASLAQLDPTDAIAAATELDRLRIFASEQPLTFAHPMLAEAVLKDAGANARGLAHLQAAHILRAARAPVAQIAGQLLRSPATGDELAAAELRAAAASARARASPESAASMLRRALVEPPAAEQRAAVAVELGQAELAGGHGEAAWEHLKGTIADGSWPLEVALGAAFSRILTVGAQEFVEKLLAAAAARRESTPDDALFLTGAAMYYAWFMPVPLRPAISLPDADVLRGATRGERIALAGLNARTTGPGGVASVTIDLSRRSLSDGRLVADSEAAIDFAAGPLLGLLYAEQLDEAARALRHVEASNRQHAWPGTLAVARFPLVYLLLLRGETAAAIAEAETLLSQQGLLEGPIRGMLEGFVCGLLVLGVLAHDGPEAADRQLGARGLDSELTFETAFAAAGRAHVHLANGRADQALTDAQTWRGMTEAIGDPIAPIEWHTIEALALAATGDLELARARAAEQLQRARVWGTPGRISAHLRASARAEPDRALKLLREAREITDGTALRLERGHVLLELGVALRRAGERTEARTALEQGVQVASECQAHALAATGVEELRVLGARPRRLAFSGADALTASERRVAELAAAGATNREIAQRLFVTAKTVDSHLMRAYRKLGISSRRELAGRLAHAA